MHTIDQTDARILSALMKDPRQSVVSLANHLGISRNTVQARLNQLDGKGVFSSYAASVNPTALGYPLVAFIHAHVQQRRLADIAAALQEIPEVVQAHGVTGPADILIRVVAEGAEDLFRVNSEILAIDGVERTDTSLAMSELIPFRIDPLLSPPAPSSM